MDGKSYVFPFRVVFFYLVTTGWIFDISLCENSIKYSEYCTKSVGGSFRRVYGRAHCVKRWHQLAVYAIQPVGRDAAVVLFVDDGVHPMRLFRVQIVISSTVVHCL